jgi:hypothetical protein
VSDINLNNNDVLYTLDDAVVTKGIFNSNALKFENIHLVAEGYTDASGSVAVKELSGSEASGIMVNQFSTQATIAIAS